MTVQFSVKNFKTFKDEVKLSLIASSYDKIKEDENIFFNEKFNLRLLKSAVIYGANASGKSKLIEAMNFMKKFVVSGVNDSLDKDEIPVDSFRLNDESENMPSVFEIIFVHDNTLYRYGFEVDKKQVISEWLYYRPKTKETELFYRDGQQFETHKTKFTKGNLVVKENLVRSNVLLLSAAAQWNDKISNEVVDWFKNLKILSGVVDHNYRGFTMGRTGEEKHKAQILELIKAADLGIQDVSLKMLDINALPSDMPKEIKDSIVKKVKEESAEFIWDVLMSHKKYNSARQAVGNVAFSLEDDESLGTQKFFSFSGPILHVLENGYTLFVDELGSQLHPNLVSKLVSLFNSKKHNPKNAQLIFNTHDTNLLGEDIFRRDQIWFTEKNKYGESKLYSLADFKSDTVRNNEAFEANYIRGKYGAIPYLDYFNYLLNSKSADSHETK